MKVRPSLTTFGMALTGVVLAAACTPAKWAKSIRRDQGTRVGKTWCDPSRGLPADASLGIEEPLRLGVGSIVHAGDSTSESFLAARGLDGAVRVPERRVEVTVIDHPSDADYSVMGVVDGSIRYAREMKMNAAGLTGVIAAPMGYLLGGTFLGTTLLIDAISSSDGSSGVTSVFKTMGIIGLGIGVAGHVLLATRPANRYAWDQTATLALRRGTVVIGEFSVRDVQDRVHWSPIARVRDASTRAVWTGLGREIGACIAADLGVAPAPVRTAGRG